MKVSNSFENRHSENEFATRLRTLSDSGAALIHVRTGEISRAVMAARKSILLQGAEYIEWNVVDGFSTYSISDLSKPELEGDQSDFMTSISTPMEVFLSEKEIGDEPYLYYIFVNPQYWLSDNPPVVHFIERYSNLLPSSRIRIILLTPDAPLPDTINDLIVTLPFDPPAHIELKGYLHNIVDPINEDQSIVDLTEEDYDRICYAGAGLSKANFEMHSSLAIVEAAQNKEVEDDETITVDEVISGINEGKAEILRQSNVLSLYQSDDIDNVGGLDNLKNWIRDRKDCFSDEAKDFGIEAPKGILLAGISGTGKTKLASTVAREFGIPLIRFDLSAVYSSLVGSTEAGLRKALKDIEAISPVTCLIDEIEKVAAGGNSSGDSGVSSRVLGNLLTWMQDNTAPVFLIATSNNIDALPPELTRRGRLDGIFGIDLPNPTEREEIFWIHLRKRGREKDINSRDMITLVKESNGYTGAEIEACIKDALVSAFAAKEKLMLKHILSAIKVLVPLSVTYAEKVKASTKWMASHAIPASSPYVEKPIKRVTRSRRRTKLDS